MAEAVSLAASIVSLAQVLSLCQQIYDFVCDVQSFEEDSRGLLTQCQFERVRFVNWVKLARLCSPDKVTSPNGGDLSLTADEMRKLDERFKTDPSLRDSLKSALQHIVDLQSTIGPVNGSTPTNPKTKRNMIPKFIIKSSRSLSYAFTKGKKLRGILAVFQQTNTVLYRLLDLHERLERLRDLDMNRQPQTYIRVGGRNLPSNSYVSGLCNLALLNPRDPLSTSTMSPALHNFDFAQQQWDFQYQFPELNQRQTSDQYSIREVFTYGEAQNQRVLVEWKYVSTVEEMPMAKLRLRKLVVLLQQASNIGESKMGVLRCLGVYSDEPRLRFGVVFDIPSIDLSPDAPGTINPERFGVGAAISTEHENKTHISLYEKLKEDWGSKTSPRRSPPLGYRFRLAEQICRYVSYLLLVGWLHKGIRSDNILFLTDGQYPSSYGNLSRPYLAGFDIARQDLDSSKTEPPAQHVLSKYATTQLNRYRHPEAVIIRGTGPQYPTESPKFKPWYDLWSLGVVLLEIAYWHPIQAFHEPEKSLEEFRARLQGECTELLRTRVGDLYFGAVKACMSGWPECSPDERVLEFDSKVLHKIRLCNA
ncbi:hypothetical protein TWF730_010932 [Orbilia blumenaviensis]|uniref:Protein kinase domain-containing protein n=1 Tax=Orbilia blumenaviensis TaxID=1796055 RepID=A0AAV9UQ55_9PEZI